MEPSYNILDIVRGTTVDGPGFRTAIYLAGCRHNCDLCHNRFSWDPNAGKSMTLSQIMEIVREEDFDVTLSGGDPLYDPQTVQPLIQSIKEDGRNVWVYTGFTWEEIIEDRNLSEAIRLVDVIVDGRYIDALHDPDLLFRGSSNQRLIDVQKSLTNKEIVYYRKENVTETSHSL